jgi:ketosteroid isomerase-like protein
MKKLFLAFAICIFMAGNLSAQQTKDVTAEITRLMTQSAADWNNANLDGFMSLYDTAATFMFPSGPVGLEKMRSNYERSYFKEGKPKQQLRFEDLQVRSLGADHALLTGKFVLYGNNLPEQKGIYSLVFVKRASGWKILHDHSS